MPTIVMTRLASKLDPSVRKKAFARASCESSSRAAASDSAIETGTPTSTK